MQNLLSALVATLLALSNQVVNLSQQIDPSTQKAQVVSSGLQYSVSNKGLVSLSYDGTDYSYNPGYIVYEFWTPPNGVESVQSASTLITTNFSNNPTSVTNTYKKDSNREWDLKLDYSGAGTNTLKIDIYAKNKSSTDTLRINFSPVSLELKELPSVYPGDAYSWRFNYPSLPLGFLVAGQKSIAWWLEPMQSNYSVFSFFRGNQTAFHIDLASAVSDGIGGSFKEKILPGEEKHWTFYLRFGDYSKTRYTIAPEVFESYRQAFPFILNWPDRRPIVRVFLTNPNTDRIACTSTNPRCYLGNGNPLGDPMGWKKSMLDWADSMIKIWDSMTIKPQGIIIWDLEGQEFRHSLTYVGDPAHIKELSPEMDAIADELIAKYQNAGYKVGLTLRPDYVLFGTTLPTTCTTAPIPNYNQMDVFIDTDGEPMYRGYICKSTNTWTQEGKAWPATQTVAKNYDQLLQIMRTKVKYSKDRWGINMFYVDSNGPWSQLWRDLLKEFPDVIFFPEHRHYGSYSVASAYVGDQPMQIWRTEKDPEMMWENKPFSLLLYAEGPSEPHYQTVIEAVRNGDILLFDGWSNFPGVSNVDKIYQAAGYSVSTPTTPAPTPPPPPVSTVPKNGDLNHDGVVNSIDYSILSRKWSQTTNISSADINGDGIIDSKDYLVIKSYWYKK